MSFGDIIKPENLTIVTLGSAVALLSASLQGGVSIAFYPEKIKNPGKTIPRAFVWATAICCFCFHAGKCCDNWSAAYGAGVLTSGRSEDRLFTWYVSFLYFGWGNLLCIDLLERDLYRRWKCGQCDRRG